MPIQMLYDRDRVQCIKSTLINGFEINKHSTKYRIMGKLKRDYGTLFFGDFDTLPEAKEYMRNLCRQIEAESPAEV